MRENSAKSVNIKPRCCICVLFGFQQARRNSFNSGFWVDCEEKTKSADPAVALCVKPAVLLSTEQELK